MLLTIGTFVLNTLYKIFGKEFVAFYILKTEPPSLSGMRRGIMYLKQRGETPKPEILKEFEEAQKRWDDFVAKHTF